MEGETRGEVDALKAEVDKLRTEVDALKAADRQVRLARCKARIERALVEERCSLEGVAEVRQGRVETRTDVIALD